MEPGNERKPRVSSRTITATSGSSTRSRGSSPARFQKAARPPTIPSRGAVTAEVNPARRRAAMRSSAVFRSSAARRHEKVSGRSSGPREGGGRLAAPPGPAPCLPGGLGAPRPRSLSAVMKPG